MISVKEAEKIILDSLSSSLPEEIALDQAYGRILAENLLADRNYPPQDKSVMDGIAISFNDWQKGLRVFNIEGMQQAGYEAKKLKKRDGCLEITTGSIIPEGCDTVIPVEEIKIDQGKAVIENSYSLIEHQHVRLKGEDYQQGSCLLEKGCRLYAPQIALAASVGKAKIKVAAQIKVAIVSTGDEIVDIDQNPEVYQTRKSNSYFIQNALNQSHLAKADVFHLKDVTEELIKGFKQYLSKYDCLISIGGVSAGKFDLIPSVLEELGCQILFHRVSQKPGRPMLFAVSQDSQPIFGLPGNPLSSQTCTYRHILPALAKTSGCSLKKEYATLTEDYQKSTDLTYYLAVKAGMTEDGSVVCSANDMKHSADIAVFANSDGFLELPEGKQLIKKGRSLSFYRWSQLS